MRPLRQGCTRGGLSRKNSGSEPLPLMATRPREASCAVGACLRNSSAAASDIVIRPASELDSTASVRDARCYVSEQMAQLSIIVSGGTHCATPC